MNSIHERSFRITAGTAELSCVIFGVLLVFWGSNWYTTSADLVSWLRIAAGLFLLFLPGALLTNLFGIGDESGGRFALFSAGFGLTIVATLAVLANVLLPMFGVEDPIRFRPLSVLLSLTAIALLGLVIWSERNFSGGKLDIVGSAPVLVLLFLLPTFAALGAGFLRQTGSTVGMYLFVSVLAFVVLLSASRVVPSNHYPIVVFFVSLSALLHVNLITNHVVGNDIQLLYFSAERIMERGEWAVGTGSSAHAIPIVTAVPAVVSMVTGLQLETTFSVVYVLLFALVPVGIYYLGREVFDDTIGLFGAVVFTVYHISFTYTPGKQLLAELFIVLLLGLYLGEGLQHPFRKVAALVLVFGLVFSHYATTYIFGLTLLGATVGVVVANRVVGKVDHHLSLLYPLVILGIATGWYAMASAELIQTLAAIPTSTFEQFETLVTNGSVSGGAGATYTSEQETPLEDLNLYLYVVLTGLIGLGLAYQTIVYGVLARRGKQPMGTELTALAIPLFGFLGLSYVIILNLYADRVFQLVLVVLAPFAAIGFRSIWDGVDSLLGRLRSGRTYYVPWSLFAIVLILLFSLNSGLAFAALDESESATFNPDAHDSVFTSGEREAATWLLTTSDIGLSSERLGEGQLEARDYPGQVPVFTDRITYQLLRSVFPTPHSTAETVVLKTAYQPSIRYEQIDEGYVFVREKSVRSTNGRRLDPAHLSQTEKVALVEPRNVIYSNGDVTIAAAGYGPGVNQTAEETESDDAKDVRRRSVTPVPKYDRVPSLEVSARE
ncbi:DUF2206 domain-containing protein [Haloarchaeobius sp. DFWS5]|uniref:DUF2206 domain-containing protein n=1 Tax=Haloarchaeobius sp. DFWS5 TaxID=3446114 RepID=UPI003EBCF3B1